MSSSLMSSKRHDGERASSSEIFRFVLKQLRSGKRIGDVLDEVDVACSGWSIEHLVAASGDREAMILLLENSNNVSATSGGEMKTVCPLHVAARYGHTDVVDLLLNSGVGANQRDKWGHTALHYAVVHAHRNTVDILLANGASPSAKNVDGHTPIDYAMHDMIVRERLLQADATFGKPGTSAVRTWLNYIGMPEYAPRFLAQGYEDLSVIAEDGLDDKDLDEIGVSLPGHRKKLRVLSRKIPNDSSKWEFCSSHEEKTEGDIAHETGGSKEHEAGEGESEEDEESSDEEDEEDEEEDEEESD